MAQYFYLMSSLPTLTTNGKNPSYEQFLSYCKTTVSEKTYKTLSSLSLDNSSSYEGCDVVKEYGKWFSELSSCLTNARKNKAFGKSEQDNSLYEIKTVVEKAMKEKNPLKAEMILLDAQFEKIDEFCSGHYFDDYVLFAYAVKLKLIERKQIFNKENGKMEFSKLFDNIQSSIESLK